MSNVERIYPEQLFDVTVDFSYSVTYTFHAAHLLEAKRYVEMMLNTDTPDAQLYLDELTTSSTDHEFVVRKPVPLGDDHAI
jgi:hypothetical protein